MNKTTRRNNLLPNSQPKYIRCYDNGGRSADRFIVCFTGKYRKGRGWERTQFEHVAMSSNPFHPQGVGQHGQSETQIDVNQWGFAPTFGRKNHLGKRIRFNDLPADCQKLVLQDYREIWGLD